MVSVMLSVTDPKLIITK